MLRKHTMLFLTVLVAAASIIAGVSMWYLCGFILTFFLDDIPMFDTIGKLIGLVVLLDFHLLWSGQMGKRFYRQRHWRNRFVKRLLIAAVG